MMGGICQHDGMDEVQLLVSHTIKGLYERFVIKILSSRPWIWMFLNNILIKMIQKIML